jgi:hypothetical protein
MKSESQTLTSPGANRLALRDDQRSPPFEIARVLARLDHVASFIVNAKHGIMKSAPSLFIGSRLTLRSP